MEVTEDLQNLLPGIYSVVVTDSNNCQITYTDTILDPSDIVLSETHVDVLCFGAATGSIDLTSIGGVQPYSYLWNNASPNQDLTSIPSGTYSVLVTDASNCTDTLSVLIAQPLAPINLNSSTVSVLCFGDENGSIDLTATGGTPGYTYSWVTGDTLQDIDTLTAGSYVVTVTDLNGCIEVLNTIVSGPSEPLLLEGYSIPICFGDTIGVASVVAEGGTPGYSYLWNTGSNNTLDSLAGLGVGSYSVLVTDANGCTATEYIDVAIVNELAGCVIVDMPNVFTPNGDFVNDLFLPVEILSIKDFNIVILNRWGNVMFESPSYTDGWDGLTPSGAEASGGVYFWKVVYEDVYGKSGVKHGSLTLIRD
jgi:gliding motility-associated-like protein